MAGSMNAEEEKMDQRVVIVHSLETGEAVWGPTAMPKCTKISELKPRILEDCQLSRTGVLQLFQEFRHGKELVSDALPLSCLMLRHGTHVEFGMTFEDRHEGMRTKLFEKVARNWRALGDEAASLANDREAVLVAVRQDGDAMQYASEALRTDMVFAEEAVGISAASMPFVHRRFHSWKPFVERVLATNWRALQYVAETLKKDVAVVMIAVRQNVAALQYAHETLTSDHEFMLERLWDDWKAVQYARACLLADTGFVKAATAKDVRALEHVDTAFLSNRLFMMEMIRVKYTAFEYCCATLKEDRQVTNLALDMAMKFASCALRSGEGTTKRKLEKDAALEFVRTQARTSQDLQEARLKEACQKDKAASKACKERKNAGNTIHERQGQAVQPRLANLPVPEPKKGLLPPVLSRSRSLVQTPTVSSTNKAVSTPKAASAPDSPAADFGRSSSSSALVRRLRSDVSVGRVLAPTHVSMVECF